MSDLANSPELNRYIIAIYGAPATGKSSSLEGIKNQNKWMYYCSEAGKELPFKNDFKKMVVTDPLAFEQNIISLCQVPTDKCEGVIIDSMDFLFSQYEDQIIAKSKSFEAWAQYGRFCRRLIQMHFVNLGRPIICIFHSETDNNNNIIFSAKGSMKGTLEAYFNTILACKCVSVDDLEPCRGKNSLLNITEAEEILGIKYCFQTIRTKDTLNEKIRSPKNLFVVNKDVNEIFIDNNITHVLDRINNYYSNN